MGGAGADTINGGTNDLANDYPTGGVGDADIFLFRGKFSLEGDGAGAYDYVLDFAGGTDRLNFLDDPASSNLSFVMSDFVDGVEGAGTLIAVTNSAVEQYSVFVKSGAAASLTVSGGLPTGSSTRAR